MNRIKIFFTNISGKISSLFGKKKNKPNMSCYRSTIKYVPKTDEKDDNNEK